MMIGPTPEAPAAPPPQGGSAGGPAEPDPWRTAAVYVKTTQDGRPVEVIDGRLCLAGVPEADALVVLDEHPNRAAILRAVPLATHMAGRVPLTMAEASVAGAAMRRAAAGFDGSASAARERLRRAVWLKAMAEGVE